MYRPVFSMLSLHCVIFSGEVEKCNYTALSSFILQLYKRGISNKARKCYIYYNLMLFDVKQ